MIKERWVNNSIANLFGGASALAFNILIPAIVARHLTAESFSVWNLALQMILFISIFSLGLQTTTARAVAFAVDSSSEGVNKLPIIVRASRSISKKASSIAILIGIGIIWLYPLLFQGISEDRAYEFRVTLIFFGLASIAQILSQVEMGVFQGLHRNFVFVAVQIVVRVVTLISIFIAIQFNNSIVVLSAVMASGISLIWPSMHLVFALKVPWSRQVSKLNVDKACQKSLIGYSASLSIWSISMLLVNSFGTLVVGSTHLALAGPYSIAVTSATVLAGLVNNMLAPLMTNAAAMHAEQAKCSELPILLKKSTLYLTIFLNLAFLTLVISHKHIISLWVGKEYVSSVAPLMLILVGAHCLRNLAAPYSLMLLALGLHHRALVSTIIEGAFVLIGSILMSQLWGATGVAFAALLSSIIGVAAAFVLNTKKTPVLTPDPIYFIKKALILPNLIFLPFQLAAICYTNSPFQ